MAAAASPCSTLLVSTPSASKSDQCTSSAVCSSCQLRHCAAPLCLVFLAQPEFCSVCIDCPTSHARCLWLPQHPGASPCNQRFPPWFKTSKAASPRTLGPGVRNLPLISRDLPTRIQASPPAHTARTSLKRTFFTLSVLSNRSRATHSWRAPLPWPCCATKRHYPLAPFSSTY